MPSASRSALFAAASLAAAVTSPGTCAGVSAHVCRIGFLLGSGELAQGVLIAPLFGFPNGREPGSCILAGTLTRRDLRYVGQVGEGGNLVDVELRLPEAVRLLCRAVGALRETRQRARPDIG